jgi:hypothetical protein
MEVCMPAGRKPDYNAVVKIGKRWVVIGAGWKLDNKEGVSVKLEMIPVGFDGSFGLLPRDENE